MCRATSFLGLFLMLSMAPTSYADLLAYEGFSYAGTGDLLGNAGGFGFTGAWYARGYNATRQDIYDLAAGSLSYSQLPTSGGRVQATFLTSAIGGIGRQLAAPMGASGTTRYVSVLLRPEGTLNQGIWNGFFGLYLDGGTNLQPDVFFGKPGAGAFAKYVLENRGGDIWQVPTTTAVTVNQAAFLVLKAEFAAAGDKYTLLANPPAGGPEPPGGVTKQGFEIGTISNLVIYSTGAFSIDEIRVGSTYADVAPVPEPSLLALLGTSAGATLAFARRRRNRRSS
jgi:hypothetical protein